MRFPLLIAILLAATVASAQYTPFPDDFTPSPCAPEGTCVSYSKSELPNAAFAHLGLQLNPKWLDTHYDEMLAFYAPICRKHATCLATPGNNHLFCDDILIREYRAVCDKNFPKSANAEDWEQCYAFTEIYALGVDQHARVFSDIGQKCAKEKQLDFMHTKAPIVWMVPAAIPRGYKGQIFVYALDPDTHVPVQATVVVQDQKIYAADNPTGVPGTGYVFKWPIKYRRVANAEGHEDLVAPMVTVASQLYPPVTFQMPSTPPKMIVEMSPKKLKRGINKVTVTARDAETGAPVEGRVLAGDVMVGDTNLPIEIEVPQRGKLPEIWVTSLFDAYGDVVVK